MTEYPLWALLRNRSLDGMEIRHVQVANASARMTRTERGGFSPCMFVSLKNWGARASLKIPLGFARVWQKDSITIFRPVMDGPSSRASPLL